MANVFDNLPLPVGTGPGTAVDVSAMGKEKTILCDGSFPNAIIAVEISNDGGVNYAPIAAFQSGASKLVLSVAAQWMRVNISGKGPVTASVNAGSNDAGGMFADLDVPVGNGAGVALAASAFGDFATFVVAGAFPDAVVAIQASDDNADWITVCSFSDKGGQISSSQTAEFYRTFVSGRSGAAFTATASVGAINELSGGGGGGPGPAEPTTFTLTGKLTANVAGVTNNFAPAGNATASWWRINPTAPATITGIALTGANIDGRMIFLQNVGAFPLTFTDAAGTSGAVNQFTTPDGQPWVLPSNGSAILIYDGTLTKWTVMSLATNQLPNTVVVGDFTQSTGDVSMSGGNATFALNATGVQVETQLSQPITLVADATGAINLVAGGDMSLTSSNGDITATSTNGQAGIVANTTAYLFAPTTSLSDGNAQLSLAGDNITASAGPTGAVTVQSPLGGSVVVNAAVHVTPFPSVP